MAMYQNRSASSSCLRLLLVLVVALFPNREHDGTLAQSMLCDMSPCALSLYLDCAFGLQRDANNCQVCACRPSPVRVCTEMMCHLVCVFRPQLIDTCPNCACGQAQIPEPRETVYFGASPERVDAAMTGQISVAATHVMQRHEGMCLRISRRWRQMDGTCNNIHNHGATFMPVARVLYPVYGDGRQSPRTRSVRGGPLPSARLVSRILHTDSDTPDSFTAMFMQFGQFIDHDITSFPLPTGKNETIRCCTKSGHMKTPSPHRDCFPIEMAGDYFFSSASCMDFVRSVPAMDHQGNMIFPRENVNSVTAFVDASAIYGSSDEELRLLRENNGSSIFLKSSPGGFLPRDSKDSCVRRLTSDPCFLAGDERVNEQPGLTTIHTVFMRLHNHLAFKLRSLLPRDSNEDVFQKARALMGAILQNILYGEWLPLVLGPVYMHRYGLNTGRIVTYNADIDPRITSVFSTAAFRFGHSMIPRAFHIGNRTPLLRNLFNQPFEVLDNLHHLTFGMINATGDSTHRAQRVDRHFVREITNHLFQPHDQPHGGLDLVSLNIQRGRDHGLPPFTRFRRECGLSTVMSFRDPALGPSGAQLEKIYSDVNDVDLFTGGMMEPRADGALVGPTFACLLARQFHSLKYGDRYYFEAWNNPNGFKLAQVAELRKATLGWVLCNNMHLASVQRDVFRIAGPGNPMLSCGEMIARGPNLHAFAS